MRRIHRMDHQQATLRKRSTTVSQKQGFSACQMGLFSCIERLLSQNTAEERNGLLLRIKDRDIKKVRFQLIMRSCSVAALQSQSYRAHFCIESFQPFDDRHTARFARLAQ